MKVSRVVAPLSASAPVASVVGGGRGGAAVRGSKAATSLSASVPAAIAEGGRGGSADTVAPVSVSAVLEDADAGAIGDVAFEEWLEGGVVDVVASRGVAGSDSTLIVSLRVMLGGAVTGGVERVVFGAGLVREVVDVVGGAAALPVLRARVGATLLLLFWVPF